MTESLSAEESEAVLAALSNRISASLPLHTALIALDEESTSPQTQRVLRELDQRLRAGEIPDVVLSELHEKLPLASGQLLHAGLEIGRLDLMMQFLLSQKQWDREFRHRLTMGFAYPTLVVVCFAAWILAILVGIVPQFESLYTGFGTNVPDVTMLLVTTSRFIFNGGFLLVIAGFAAIIAGWCWMFFGNVSGAFNRNRRRFPILSSIVKLRQFSEFCDILAILLEGSLPLPQAILFASSGLADGQLQETFRSLAKRIKLGESVESVASSLDLPRSFTLILRQPPNESARELRTLATVYATKGDFAVRSLIMSVDILVMLSVSIMIVLVLSGLFIPMISILNELS